MCVSTYESPKLSKCYCLNQHTITNIKARFESINQYSPKELKEIEILKNGETNITLVKSNCYGKINFIDNYFDYGFIEYTLSKELLHSTISRNGASQLPENTGKIFFHKSEFTGNLNDRNLVNLNSMVEFDLVHYKTTNKIIANRVKVYHLNQPKHQIQQLAHFQKMQITEPVPTADLPMTYQPEQPKITYVGKNFMGQIMSMNENKRGIYHCELACQKITDGKIIMFHKEMINSDFSNAKIGDTFRFNLFKNNHSGIYLARACQFIPAYKIVGQEFNAESATSTSQAIQTLAANTLAHHQFTSLPVATLETPQNKFTPIKFKNLNNNKVTKSVLVVISKLLPSQKVGFVSLKNDESHKFLPFATKIINCGKIFFNERSLINLPFDTLKTGQILKISVKKNTENGKLIAENVEMPSKMEMLAEFPAAKAPAMSVPSMTGFDLTKSILGHTAGLPSVSVTAAPSSPEEAEVRKSLDIVQKYQQKHAKAASKDLFNKPINNILLGDMSDSKRRKSIETMNLASTSRGKM